MSTKRTAPMAYAENRNASLALLSRIASTLNNLPIEKGLNAHWGDVGSMAHVREQLQALSDQLHSEGEFAPENVA